MNPLQIVVLIVVGLGIIILITGGIMMLIAGFKENGKANGIIG